MLQRNFRYQHGLLNLILLANFGMKLPKDPQVLVTPLHLCGNSRMVVAQRRTKHRPWLYPVYRAEETYLFDWNPQQLEKNFNVAFQIEESDGPGHGVNASLLVVPADDHSKVIVFSYLPVSLLA